MRRRVVRRTTRLLGATVLAAAIGAIVACGDDDERRPGVPTPQADWARRSRERTLDRRLAALGRGTEEQQVRNTLRLFIEAARARDVAAVCATLSSSDELLQGGRRACERCVRPDEVVLAAQIDDEVYGAGCRFTRV